MKPESEIRKHLSDLKKAAKTPCNCMEKGLEHNFGCFVGGRMLAANIEVLSWVLGDNGNYDHIAEHFSASVKKRS